MPPKEDLETSLFGTPKEQAEVLNSLHMLFKARKANTYQGANFYFLCPYYSLCQEGKQLLVKVLLAL